MTESLSINLDAIEAGSLHLGAGQPSASTTVQQPEVQRYHRNRYPREAAGGERERAPLHVGETSLRISQVQRQPGKSVWNGSLPCELSAGIDRDVFLVVRSQGKIKGDYRTKRLLSR